MESFILSASGWRRVFASDGGAESRSPDIGCTGRELAAAAAGAFADFLRERSGKNFRGLSLAVGMDSRFTGPAIAEMMLRVFILRGIKCRYVFICSAPEIMAWAGGNPEIDGFAYVSASHNPVGYNGVKFGLGGGVLGGGDAAALKAMFQELAAGGSRMRELITRLSAAGEAACVKELEEVFLDAPRRKKEAENAYTAFIRRVITGRDAAEEQRPVLEALREGIRGKGCGIVIDFNGSARSLGIDAALLESFGITLKTVNAKPREINHAIEPEGDALIPCARALEKARETDSSFVFGYVPDNDGDRGNIVIYDEADNKARVLEPQEVFSLACYAELAFLAWQGGGSLPEKTAAAVNDPTSMRIDRIAESFGAKVFRAEVGEANVVALARKLRAEGWTVRILGEGSNGGNITHPSEVRDPLSTVFALLKLLYLPIFHGRPARNLREVLDSLPRFLTLAVTAKEARLTIQTRNQGALKARYEEIFLREWQARKEKLRGFGIESWEELNHEGSAYRAGMGKAFRTGNESGGLTMLLEDSGGAARAFLWMRGSGTEPVFRISADVEGEKPELLRYLVDWQTAMVREADS